MSAGPWVVEWAGERPLTINKVADLNRFAWAKHTKSAREVWAGVAMVAHLPRGLARVAFVVTPLHRTAGSPQDVAACAPEAKAAIDGMRDYGLIADDKATIVPVIVFLAPDVCGKDGMRIEIHELAAQGELSWTISATPR